MRFLYNAPALYHKGALIIGDTHFGIEERLKKEGVHSEDFSEKILEKVLKLLNSTKVKRLIILGDVKENIAYVDENTRTILKKLENRTEHIIAAHQHPMVEFTDAFDKKHSRSAWLILEPNLSKIKKHYKNFNRKIKLILMPAFNPLAGKSIKLNASGQLGPLLSNSIFKLNESIVYTLDGSYLGKL